MPTKSTSRSLLKFDGAKVFIKDKIEDSCSN